MDSIVNLLGLSFCNVSLAEFVLMLHDDIEHNKKIFVHTVNVDHVVEIQNNEKFRDAAHAASYVTADGMPIIWLSWLLGRKLKGRVTGADIAFEICKHAADYNFKIYLFGAAPGVADLAKHKICTQFHGIQVVGTYSPTADELLDHQKSVDLCQMINQSGANILLLALGAPKQELWYQRFSMFLDIPATIGVGAAIDFLAGTLPRAPMWMQRIGAEWIYRLAHDPRRLFKRYLIRDIKFLKIAFKELINSL